MCPANTCFHSHHVQDTNKNMLFWLCLLLRKHARYVAQYPASLLSIYISISLDSWLYLLSTWHGLLSYFKPNVITENDITQLFISDMLPLESGCWWSHRATSGRFNGAFHCKSEVGISESTSNLQASRCICLLTGVWMERLQPKLLI